MMSLTTDEKKKLRSYKTVPDCDDIRIKEIIKQHLIDNKLIIYTLNDKKKQTADAPAYEYLDENILGFYLIKPTQVDIKNYICYEVQFDEEMRYNPKFKRCQIVFTILCEQKDIKDNITGIARHDLLAALILDEFNWTNYFGFQVHCVSDQPSTVDTNFACRTLVFEGKMFNNLVKTDNGVSRVVNSEVNT